MITAKYKIKAEEKSSQRKPLLTGAGLKEYGCCELQQQLQQQPNLSASHLLLQI